MQGCVVGFDGGGTKTAVCAVDLSGKQLACETFGALNINGSPKEKVQETIRAIMKWIVAHESDWGKCHSILVGTAGVSNPLAEPIISEAVRATDFAGTLSVTGDQDIALRGAVGKVGAVLIAGTGTVCKGRNHLGQAHRTGGFGYLIDDEGSGYAIGRDILTAIVRSHDGRSDKTMLVDAVFEMWQIRSIPELIRETYAHVGEKKYMAALAPLLLKGLEANDAASIRIADKAASELATLLLTVLETLQLEDAEYAFIGGILHHCPTIANGVRERIANRYPNTRYILAKGDAAYGAASLALDALT